MKEFVRRKVDGAQVFLGMVWFLWLWLWTGKRLAGSCWGVLIKGVFEVGIRKERKKIAQIDGDLK